MSWIRRILAVAVCCGVAAYSLRAEAPGEKAAKLEYSRDVLPILSNNCFSCHGPDEANRKAKLRLDQRESAIKPRKSGDAAYGQGDLAGSFGRDHHPRCFSYWLAGGGVKAGSSYGSTDDYGYNVAENPVHVNDLHATLLQLLGIDHERLTYRFGGRDFRLTDVAGRAINEVIG